VPNATITPAAGVGTVGAVFALNNIPRSLYLYENIGVEPQAIAARSLYLYENVGVQIVPIAARSLYLYENVGIGILAVLARSLYLYEATRDGEVFPWLMKLDPTEQYAGGQVSLFGDGFGELLEAGEGATITASTTSGGNLPAYTVDRVAAEWVSTEASPWIRYTFGAAKSIVGLAIEDRESATNSWGVPLFRFSDLGADVNGGTAVPKASAAMSTAEYPVGGVRTLYSFPARTVTWVEIRVASGGAGTARGLREVWIFEDLDAAAEGSAAILNDGLPAEGALGIVTWRNRSPGLWPANGGQPITGAATVTIPADAVSGLVLVEETI
jgi:hypothetical protein